jgi:hypothetical protein
MFTFYREAERVGRKPHNPFSGTLCTGTSPNTLKGNLEHEFLN